jgi:hypothetical protein
MASSIFFDPNTKPRYFTREANGKVQQTTLSITARVNDLEAWKRLEGVVTRFAGPHLSQWMVVAYVEAEQFEALSQLPFVLECSVAPKPTLVQSAFGSEARAADYSAALQAAL